MPVDRREFVRAVGGAGVALAAGIARTGEAQTPRRPNILFVMTDQQPATCLGAAANDVIATPALDDLAGRGCLFENFYIAAFPCSPSRASMLTGRYPHNHGVMQNDVLLEPSVPCLGDICHQAGYATGYFGKWHLGGNMYRGRRDDSAGDFGGHWYYRRDPQAEGFAFQRVAGGSGEDAPQHGFETWAGGWEHYHRFLREVGQGELLEKNPRVGNHNDAPSGAEGTHIYSQLSEDHHMAAFFSREAERFVRANAHGVRPWCAVLSFYGPHLPTAPPRPWDEMYALDEVALPPSLNDSLEGKPVGQRTNSRCHGRPSWTDEQFRDYIRRYYGYCSYLDRQIGKVFAALQETGQWQDTLVVFTSDHGDMMAGHGMIYKLGRCGYEELYRVPALMHVPGVTRPGSRTDALCSNTDLLPTILQAAGLSAPPGMDGRSLAPLLAAQTDTHRETVFADCSNTAIVSRRGSHKFTLNWHNRDLDELYDLQADPHEMHNLAYEAPSEPLASQLREGCLQWARDAGHPFAALIAAEAAKGPQTRVLEIAATGEAFRYLGGDEFELGIAWQVARDIQAEGTFWAFTQFCNRQYATDGDIVFRFTPYPKTPVTQWKAGQTYHIGPVKVKLPPHAGPGKYQVRTGLWDPQTRTSPGHILRGQGNAMLIGTLTIERQDGRITKISYEPLVP